MLRVCLLAGLIALTSATAPAQTPHPSLREIAESGDPQAAYVYGLELTFPEDGDPDLVTGRYWLVQAANEGIAPANHILGVVYRDGIGVDGDLDRARAFFELSWQAGDPAAGYDLADLLLYDYADERPTAIAILESLITDAGFGPLARLTLAEILMFDDETDGDTARAVTLARDALAEQPELIRAHYLLGIAAAEGLDGPVDQTGARHAWGAGAAAGDPLALSALADSWMDPEWGEPDPVEAMLLYELAAALGDDFAADRAAALAIELGGSSSDSIETRRIDLLSRLGWEIPPGQPE